MQHLELQKLNGGSEANQAVNGLSVDEKDNFLQQIRTKVSCQLPLIIAIFLWSFRLLFHDDK